MVIITAIEPQRVRQPELLPQHVHQIKLRPQRVRQLVLVRRRDNPHRHQPNSQVDLHRHVNPVQTILPSKDHLHPEHPAPEVAEVTVEAGVIVVAELPEVGEVIVEVELPEVAEVLVEAEAEEEDDS